MKLTTNIPHIDALVEEVIKQAKETKVPGLLINIVTEAYCSTEGGTEGFVTISTTYELDESTGDASILHTNSFSNRVDIYESLVDGKFLIGLEGVVTQHHKGDILSLGDHAKGIVDYLFMQGYYDPKRT